MTIQLWQLFREVAFVSDAGKVFLNMGANRLSDHSEARGILPETQCGLRPARWTVSMLVRYADCRSFDDRGNKTIDLHATRQQTEAPRLEGWRTNLILIVSTCSHPRATEYHRDISANSTTACGLRCGRTTAIIRRGLRSN